MALSDDLTKHQIFIQRLAGTEYKNIKDQLVNLGRAAKLEAASGTSGKVLKNNLRQAMSGFTETGVSNMADLAEYEAQFSGRLFKKYFKQEVSLPSRDKLVNQLRTNNMEINNISRAGTRKSLSTAYKQFGNRKADELSQLIRDAQAQGLNASEISSLIDEKINGLHSTQARALAKTNVNYTSNVARNATVAENKDIFDKMVWVSVLDSGTTAYCSEHDGRIYGINEGPRPPAHWGCRSHVEPLNPNN